MPKAQQPDSMSMAIPLSFYLEISGNMLRVSKRHRGTVKYLFTGRRSTICRYPPVRFGSRRDADTHGVGEETGVTAPSESSFGSSTECQYVSSSYCHVGLLLWNGLGVSLKGILTPCDIHYKTTLLAPVLAQNLRCLRINP